jgi:1-acyl-sn-glycerol-3-phosphate acyltransferase
MGAVHSLGVLAFKSLTRAICRVDDAQLEKIPDQGPLILVANHVHIMELPLLYTHLQPRPITGMVAARRWDNFWTRWLVEQSGSIPLRRGAADVSAIRQAMAALDAGRILAIAPEGTRGGDGALQKGRSGVVLLALQSGAPIIPVVHYGSEEYKRNLARLKRSDFHFVVGEAFRLAAPEGKVSRQIRLQIADEIMYRLADLLPIRYRGVYSDMEKATEEFIVPL